MKRICIYLIIISLCIISGSYTTRVHATIDITKGERLIYHKQYDEAYQYFTTVAVDTTSADGKEKRDRILEYLEIIKYAQNHLQTLHRGEHVVVHYDPALVSGGELSLLSERYDHSYMNIKKELAITFDQPVHIFLYPEGMELVLWESLGLLSVYNSDEIHVFYGGVDNHGHIEHEMVHIMTEHLNSFRGRSTLPTLLIEGLAEYIVADPWGLELNQWVKGFMELGVFLPFKELQVDENFRRYNQIITYEEAGSFVHYLITQYGLDKFKLLYSQPSFYTVYGKTLETLAHEWSQVIQSVEVSGEDRDRISFRVALGALYMKPAVLAQVPWIGIKTSVNQERVFIEKVAESSPAERGYLREGDEVVGVNDIEIHGKNVWRIGSLLLDKRAGDCVSFAVRRDGKLFHREITLGMKPYRTWQ